MLCRRISQRWMIILGKMAICTSSVLKKQKHDRTCFLSMFILVFNMGSVLYLSWLTFKTMDDLALFRPVLPNYSPFCDSSLFHEIAMFNLSFKKFFFWNTCSLFPPFLSFLLFVLLIFHQYLNVSCVPGTVAGIRVEFCTRGWHGLFPHELAVCPAWYYCFLTCPAFRVSNSFLFIYF